MTVATQPRALLECDATLTIRGAQIIVEGPFDFAREKATVAVTGGTGPYRTAHGVVHVVQTSVGLRFNFDLLI